MNDRSELNTGTQQNTGAQRDDGFRPDGFGTRARIGLIYMASSTVMEPEMYAMAPDGVSIHTARLSLPTVTVSGIDAMMNSPELEQATRAVAAAPLDVICFGGTSASFLHGTAWDHSLLDRMNGWSDGITCTTTSTASLAALRAVDAKQITLATPYVDEIIERAVRFFGDNGHDVLASRGLGITSDHALAEVTPQQVYDLACEVDVPESSAVFISCTNLRTVAVIEALERDLGKPVVSAVQASMWHALRLAGVDDVVGGYGTLLTTALRSSH